ncbi:RDD family protein [Sanyastnella coralliicola]|uniref:RDD family protein n=1 Tax=Sanyastnella coralliicola TaxID=3069118 RepID=UPI0027B8ADCF|nr:RDD family protein [Longitalea sp. SCSIO 12813]
MELMDDELLPDEEREVYEVDKRTRLAHFFVDVVAIAVLSYLIMIITIQLEIFTRLFDHNFKIPLITTFTQFMYYMICESLTQKTLGKTLTGSRVTNLQNGKTSFKQILVRTAIRLIPLYPFFFLLNQRWHDQWSGTKVVE